ncbi:hypothetical protein EC991_004694 [Linnemannia zychae]|nr:hypothetical protein EC991_004694 [Linnemannia zychae]
MDRVLPLCFTTNGAYIYTVAYHSRQGSNKRNRFVLARSLSSLPTNLTWQVIGGTFKYPSVSPIQYTDYSYNCAWNPDTSIMTLMADIWLEPNQVHPYAKYRIGVEVPTMDSAFKAGTREFDNIKAPGPTIDLWPSFRRNRGVLMPNMSLERLLWSPMTGLGFGSTNMPTWFFAQINGEASSLTLAESDNGGFPQVYSVTWYLDAYGSSLQGSIRYEILAHSNDKFFVVGSVGETGHLVGLTIPFSLSHPSSSQPDPTLSSNRIVESAFGQDCDLGHKRTTIAMHEDQMLVLCYPKAQPFPDVSKQTDAFQLYSFNGTTFQHIGFIATSALTPVTDRDPAPQLTIAPVSSSKDSGAKWAYISLNFGDRIYSLDITKSVADTANVTQTYLSAPKPFTLDHDSEFPGWVSPTTTHVPTTGNRSGISSPWIIWVASILLVCTVVVKLILSRRRKEKQRLALEQAHFPICPDPRLLPTHHRPRGSRSAANAGSEGGAVGVSRTQYGEDASDALPMYTFRTSSAAATSSMATVVPEVEATAVDTTLPIHPLSPPPPISSPPLFHAPEHVDPPPYYATRPSSPVQSHEPYTPVTTPSPSAEGSTLPTTTTTTAAQNT